MLNQPHNKAGIKRQVARPAGLDAAERIKTTSRLTSVGGIVAVESSNPFDDSYCTPNVKRF
jgi:hypothetical protein